MNDATRYAIIVRGKEQLAYDKTVMTRDGERFWVMNDHDGWVDASSVHWTSDGAVPADVKTFESKEAADRFARRWKGHPWWCSPKPGEHEIVAIEPVFEQRRVGYKVATT